MGGRLDMGEQLDAEVLELANSFARLWNAQVSAFPLLQLDLTWPSIGTIDLLTSRLRRKNRLDFTEQTLVTNLAAYVAQLASGCWTSFSSNGPSALQFSLRLSKGARPDVLLAMEHSPLLKPGERFSIAVNQVIRRILRSNALFFESLPHLIRKFDPAQNYLSSLALGIMTGLCPYGKGPWSSADWQGSSKEKFAPQISAAVKLLAQSCAAFYARNFPQEPIGQAPELYERALIFPPTMVDEPFPGVRSVDSLLRYLAERRYPLDQILSLLLNLAQFPDDLISNIGFVCASALVDREIPEILRIVAQSKGLIVSTLRPALLAARVLFGGTSDVLIALEQNNQAEARRLLAIERDLGFIPALNFIDESLTEPWLLPVIESLSCFNSDTAREELTKLAASQPLPSDVIFESINLNILAGDLEAARQSLTTFRSAVIDMSKHEEASYLALLGQLAFADDQLAEARDAMLMSYQLSDQMKVGLTAAGLTLSLGDYEQAAEIYQGLSKQASWNVAAHLGYTNSLMLRGLHQQALGYMQTLPQAMFLKRELFVLFLEAMELQPEQQQT